MSSSYYSSGYLVSPACLDAPIVPACRGAHRPGPVGALALQWCSWSPSFLPCGPPYASLLLCARGGPRLPRYAGGVAGASTPASTWQALVLGPGADRASG